MKLEWRWSDMGMRLSCMELEWRWPGMVIGLKWVYDDGGLGMRLVFPPGM